MIRNLSRFAALTVAAMFAAGMISVAPAASAATKPSKPVVKACQDAMRESNHVVSHFGDYVDIVNAQGEALSTLFNSQGTEADVQNFNASMTAVQKSLEDLQPQIEAAQADYEIAQSKCLKVLGLKHSDIEPPAAATTTTGP